MKQEFIEFLNDLMASNPEFVASRMTDNIKLYIEALNAGGTPVREEVTEKGKNILKYLQDNSEIKLWKSKDVAEGMGLSSRSTSGTLIKLANDGYLEKLGKDPVVYTMTEKGKNYIIEENE